MIQNKSQVKIALIVLGFIFLTVTLYQDYFRSPSKNIITLPDKTNDKNLEKLNNSNQNLEENIEHNHNHGHQEKDELSPFDKLPAPAPDPIKQRRMGIFHYNEGNKFLKEGKWKLAIENYEMALSHDKEIYQVYLNMSNAFLLGKQWDQAIKTLKILESQKPNLPALHYNLACYYSLTQQIEKSLTSIQQAVNLGYKPRNDILIDPDLEPLRKSQAFQKWIDSVK